MNSLESYIYIYIYIVNLCVIWHVLVIGGKVYVDVNVDYECL